MKNLAFKTLIIGTVVSIQVQAQSLQEGLRALDFEKYESARNIFTTLTVNEPKNADNWYYLGQAYLNLYKEDSAKWAYEKGTAIAPTSPANFIGLGELLMAENKKTEANQLFNKALSFSKGRDGMIKDANALRLVAAALIATDNKSTNEALEHIKNALSIAPKNYEVLITAGDVYLELNNGGESASQYERAEGVDPKNAKAYTRVAAIWLRVKNAEQTFTDLNKALEIDPNYAPALKLMSELYYKSKKYEKAKQYYTKYLENSEPSVANQKRFAKILFNAKEYEDALPKILDVIKLEDSDVYMHRLAGYSYYEVGDAKKDTNMFKAGVVSLENFMVKVDPAKILPSDYEYLGKLYSRIPGKDSLASINMQKAIELAPEKIELMRDAGMMFNKLKRFEQSVMYFEMYIAKAPKVTLVDWQLLGLAAYYGKKFAKSDSAFAKILELKADYADGYFWRAVNNAALDPDFKTPIVKEFLDKYLSTAEADPVKNKRNLITAYNTMGQYYIQKEDNANAKLFFQKTLALDPENKLAKEVVKQIK